MKSKFRLDRRNGKLMGVCAGIANSTGWDPTLVRVAAVLVTLLGAFPWTVIAYFIAAFVASKQASIRFEREEAPRARMSARDLQASMRDIDHRMVEVDSYVASPNSRLAEEIDSLR